MPKRTDISTILIIGAGPIVIGQACEFDYSGTQAVKALKEEGYRVVLVNSNPATIMTDPELADATYIEPITPEIVARIIEKERHVIPGGFALLPTMGGQTALNCALSLRRQGTLEKFDVEMIGATADAIDKAEDRQLFRNAMEKIGLQTPKSRLANASALKKQFRDKYLAEREKLSGPARDELDRQWSLGENERRKRYQEYALGEAMMALSEIGLPAIIRPSFTMGGTGGGIAYNKEEFLDIIERGLDASPTNEVLIEESVLGWKEYEMEVVRDKKDNCIIICSIENLDPMGVHTGDSITVAPALTLTDKEYQIMRDALLGAGLKGDRLPDRQGRGQARRRLHARRDRQRHHRRRDAGVVRADHRLCRHQDPALCLRKIPGRLDHADHLDEVGRRGHGDRTDLPGEPAKGAPRSGDGPDRPRRDRDRRARPRRRQERDPRRPGHADAEPDPAGGPGHAPRLVGRGDLQLLQD